MGRPKKVIPPDSLIKPTTSKKSQESLHCVCCGEHLDISSFYKTRLAMYKGIGVIPFCKSCVAKLYHEYYNKYAVDGILNPDKKAIERICMMFNVYYSDEVFNGAVRNQESGNFNDDTAIIAFYFKQVNMHQYYRKTYDTTVEERLIAAKVNAEKAIGIVNVSDDVENQMKIDKAKKFFGTGFSADDYVFLQDQYEDWTTRHECQTKSQEEMFKHICYTQLDIKKAKQKGLDTKDLDATFLRQLEAAKLQPKQNKGDTTSETQTFGTLIEKWETTRPIPEIDEELRDVDKIGLYLNVFFQGHLAKMMGLKNGLSRMYEKYMEKYTVKRPEYNDDEDGEALFDAIFGNAMNED